MATSDPKFFLQAFFSFLPLLLALDFFFFFWVTPLEAGKKGDKDLIGRSTTTLEAGDTHRPRRSANPNTPPRTMRSIFFSNASCDGLCPRHCCLGDDEFRSRYYIIVQSRCGQNNGLPTLPYREPDDLYGFTSKTFVVSTLQKI